MIVLADISLVRMRSIEDGARSSFRRCSISSGELMALAFGAPRGVDIAEANMNPVKHPTLGSL